MSLEHSSNRRIRVAVVFGGRSAEHDVSLRSAQTIIGALDPTRYDVVPIGITRDGQWLSRGDPMGVLTDASPMFHLGEGESASTEAVDDATLAHLVRQAGAQSGAVLPPLATEGIDVVIPALHGPMGEDGTVQGLFELAGVPYVGSGVLGSAVAMDKAIAKTILAQAGLPQLPWRLLTRKELERDPDGMAEGIAVALGFPLFVKPANLGSSVGISRATDVPSLRDALTLAAQYDRRLIVERGVSAREIEVAVLGNEEPIASIPGEIVPHGEFYDFAAKYVDDSAELIVPAPLDRELVSFLQSLAVDAFRALDLAGLARVDFFVESGTDRVFVNEVNTLPGFTSISMYPMLWEASGVPLEALVERLIQLAVERHAEAGSR